MSLLTPFKDEEDAMRWYYTPHSMALDSAPMGIIDYFQMPPQQMPPQQMPPQQMPSPVETPVETMPTEMDYSRPVKAWGPASGGVPGSTRISQHMADWILNKYPEQEMSDRYSISGWDTSVGTSPETGWTPIYDNPILSYNQEINQEYLNSPEYKEYYNIAEQFGETESTADLESTPPLASLPIIPISDSITTPLEDSTLPPPEEYIPETYDESSFPPLESYDFSGFGSYLDSLPSGAITYEDAVQNYIGRPLTSSEEQMFIQQESNLGNIRNLFDIMSPEDYYSSTPIITPDSFIPQNNDGLMNIVGGGIIDPGPVMDNPY
jgi:hypothetical protein